MSAITSTTAGSLFSWLAQANSQSQTTATPADSLLTSEADSANQGSQSAPGNILAAIAALTPFNSALSQDPATNTSLAAFLGTLEQNDAGALDTSASTATAAHSTTSATADLTAIANSNDTSSQQAAIAQLLSSDGINSHQLQMDFLTAVLGSSNSISPANTNSSDLFSALSQKSATDSSLNVLA